MSEGLRTQDLEANTELRHSTFSEVELSEVPFEEREGMEGEHTPETDLTMPTRFKRRETSLKV